jgi:hypothetical protein
MEYKVAELEGALLDAAVAKAEGARVLPGRIEWPGEIQMVSMGGYRPGEDWFDGGPIIERERLVLGPTDKLGEWIAYADGATITDWGSDTITGSSTYGTGPTPLVAAMRAYVASKFGATVDLGA